MTTNGKSAAPPSHAAFSRSESARPDGQEGTVGLAALRSLPPLSVMPTLCTLGNLLAGFAAIFYATRPESWIGPWGWSGLTFASGMVFLGILLDAFDGTLARLTGSLSELGAQLDSLADMVTCGIAPAVMVIQLAARYSSDSPGYVIGPEADNELGKVIWAVAAVYVSCAALRLARFNVERSLSEEADHGVFNGLPTPGAAGMVVSLIILHQHILVAKYAGGETLGFARTAALGMPFVMLLCAIAMVSSIPYVHATSKYLGGKRTFAQIVRIVVPLVLAIWWFQETVAVVFSLYALSGPVQSLRRRMRDRRKEPARSP